MFFVGTYTPKLDASGRFFMPSKLRDQLKQTFYITPQKEGCLAIWTEEGFVNQAATVRGGGPTDTQEDRDFLRLFASSATDQAPDGQGRVGIPPELRRYAGLTKDIAVLGVFDHVEIWDEAKWAEYRSAKEKVFAQRGEEN